MNIVKTEATRRVRVAFLWLLATAIVATTGARVEAEEIVVDGACNLVDAIEAANTDLAIGACPAGSGEDRVTLTEDVLLAEVNNTTNGPNGLPSITAPLTIDGQGFAIERDPNAIDFRLLHTQAAVSLRNLRLSGGRVPTGQGAAAWAAIGGLDIYDSEVSANEAASIGGSIYSPAPLSADPIRIYRTEIIDNLTAGIAANGTVEVRDSVVARNSSPGLDVGRARVERSTIEGNGADGIAASDDATIIDTEVAMNSGIGIDVNDDLVLRNTTISNNGAQGVEFSAAFYGYVNIDQSTISDNGDDGFTLRTDGVTTIIKNTTIAGNEGFGLNTIGIFYSYGIFIKNVVVAENVEGDCGSVDLATRGVNLSSDGSCEGTGPMTGLDPVLADNGGLTRTHALLPGSSAIDAGECDAGSDQRGYGRSVCDVGAFELGGTLPLATSITGTCPGTATLSITGATPDARIRVMISDEVGTSIAPDGIVCGSIMNNKDREFELRTPLLGLSSFVVDALGNGTSELNLDASACGGKLQAIDLATCQKGAIQDLP